VPQECTTLRARACETHGVTVNRSQPEVSDQDLYDRLAFYTLELRDPEFIHQQIVDAYAVQHAGPGTKPIAVVFGLIGLYLYVEKNFTGRQVQRAHMQLARNRRWWTAPPIPLDRRATIGVADVLAAPPGPLRHAMIYRWCEAVWQDWQASRSQITALAQTELGIDP
jgi:hypothetical protein